MFKEIELKLAPEKAFDKLFIDDLVLKIEKLHLTYVEKIEIVKRSIDARKQPIIYLLKIRIFLKTNLENNNLLETVEPNLNFELSKNPNSVNTKKIAIIGVGPAGIFAAFQLLEMGFKPIVIERGKKIKERRRDLAELNKKIIVNNESNYCFGEGGAGTYSDGKLYTRSKKRGNVEKVLQTFVKYGADTDILVNTHPHIGTNKLPAIIENMRESILAHGGEIFFESKLTNFKINNNIISEIEINGNNLMAVDEIILATGHSARDIFELLHSKQIKIEPKSFALGVRIEHPQMLIDKIQYKRELRGDYLPPAAYSLVTQASGCGVFSFCMCPGGIIAPASTNQNETVVNGWSPSKRNGEFANSGMVVTVEEKHWQPLFGQGNLAALEFQKMIEKKAFDTSNSIIAPAQRVEDFIQKKISKNLPKCSYLPGIQSHDLDSILPPFISKSLKEGLIQFGKQLYGYRTNEAILVGVESRTSSPVRIPRNKETMRHVQIKNLIPCGEGAGYAGGIVSAAIDGILCALACEYNN